MPAPPHLRPLIPPDLPAAIRLWESTEGLGKIDSFVVLEGYLQRNAGISQGAFAQNGDELVAAVLCGHDGRRGYLYHLAVLPDYRGQGLATQLVDQCLEALAVEGIGRCTAFVYTEHQAAIDFWAKSRWQRRTDLHLFSQVVGDGC